jgi:hypothetical protein
MLFEEQRSADESTFSDSPERQVLIRGLLADFQQAFPTIEFSLVGEFKFLNAQALHLGSRKLVKLYGGLAFHGGIGQDALGFALLHETGHHLAKGSRLVLNPWLACECVSDLWAINEGAASLFKRTGRSICIVKAVEELDRALGQSGIGDTGFPALATHFQSCWAMSWHNRKRSILMNRPVIADGECPMAELMMAASKPQH